MDDDGKTPEHKFSGVEFQFFQQTTTTGTFLSLSYKTPAGRAEGATQMVTNGKDRSISWTPPIKFRVSGPSIKH